MKNIKSKNKIKNSTKSDVLRLICICIVLFVIYIALDLADIPSRFIASFSHINEDILGVVINSFVVIVLYIISYYAIEKHQRDKTEAEEEREKIKHENSKKAANLLINNTYTECLETLRLIGNPYILEEFIVPKIDFSKTLIENELERSLLNRPFNNIDQILNFAASGYIDQDELKNYFEVQKKFRSVVMQKITFFDLKNIEHKTEKQLELEKSVGQDFNELYSFLEFKVQQ